MCVLVKSKKGFSLIEILIAVAVMVILASLAVGIFSNVLTNSKERSDSSYARNLETAVQTYITESEDLDLDCGGSPANTAQDLVDKLSNTIVIGTKKYGPYLNSNVITLSKNQGVLIDVDKEKQTVKVTVGSYDVNAGSSLVVQP